MTFQSAKETPVEKNGRLICCVDDDKMVRSSLEPYLRSVGFSTISYGTGREFISNIAEMGSGCVLLDLQMPEMDGFSVLDELHGYKKQVTVIAMTGYGDIPTAVRAMKLGADDFLEKPFENNVLIKTILSSFIKLDRRSNSSNDNEAAKVVKALSTREKEVLQGLAEGQSNKLLAYRLSISVRTVEMHRANLMRHLSVKTLAEALEIAFKSGILNERRNLRS